MTTQINASVLQSPCDAVGTETNRMRQYKRSKKAKISTLAFSVYASKVMYSNNNSWHNTKAAVPLKKDCKYYNTQLKYLSYSVFINIW